MRSFSAADQQQRRPPAVMISTSDMSTCLGLSPSLHGHAKVSGPNGGQFTALLDGFDRASRTMMNVVAEWTLNALDIESDQPQQRSANDLEYSGWTASALMKLGEYSLKAVRQSPSELFRASIVNALNNL